MEGRTGAWRLMQPQQQQQRGPGAPVAGLPIGFRFRPTDEELLLHYLRRKALACPLPAGVIPDADLARLYPWDLLPAPGGAGADADGERFFFHRPATRCWRKGGGAARVAGTGVWRPSGKESLVVSPRCKGPVGTKRTLVFFSGRGGGARARARTDWAMHEYRLLPAGLHPHGGCANTPPPPSNNVVSSHSHGAASDWVVCRIFKRTRPGYRARFGGREEENAEESPSSPSSCVTDASETLEEVDGDEGSSSSCCSVASN